MILSIEQKLIASCVKYERLHEETYRAFSNSPVNDANKLNIFLDLSSIIRSIFSEHHTTEVTNYTSLTSTVVNICAHYRTFFKRLGVATKFYLVFSYNNAEIYKKFVSEYNSLFSSKVAADSKLTEMANTNLELLEILCPYLPGIYFVKSVQNYESSILMHHIMNMLSNVEPGVPNLIISKDLYPLQLTVLHPFTAFLYPIKFSGEDRSVMIPVREKPEFITEFWELVARIRVQSLKNISAVWLDVAKISPINFPMFSAINKFPERSLNSLGGLSKAVEIINDIVEDSNIKIISDQLYSNDIILSKIQVPLVDARLKVLDLEYIYPYYLREPECNMIKFEDLEDASAVNMINSKFFSSNPVNVEGLL